GPRPLGMLRLLEPHVIAMDKDQLKRCAKHYLVLGWSGRMPKDCRHTLIILPLNYVHLAWGWPNRLIARLNNVGSLIFVAGPYSGRDAPVGLNTPAEFSELPRDYAGGIWTDEIETIAPLIERPR